MGRAAQGVKLISLKNNAEIAAIARVPRSEEEDEDEEVIAADNHGDQLPEDGTIMDDQDADSTSDNDGVDE
jgi:DNA gyrase subunit A